MEHFVRGDEAAEPLEPLPRHPLPRRLLRALGALLGDRRRPARPPLGNFVPDSDGQGGRVISSGHPGGI